MDAITLLKQDHQTVAQLFTRFERAGDEAYETKRKIVDRIIEELSVHAAIEELAFYPAVRRQVKGAEDQTLEGLEEHHIVKWQLSELEGMDPRAERFDAKVTVLIENVKHHVEEEEDDLFPKVRSQLSRTELAELGERLAAAKSTVPTRPHPRTPDTPPGNLIAGTAAGLVDKATDAVKSAVSDTISRVTRSGGDVADKISSTASDAEDAVERTARRAGTATKRTGRKATKRATASTKRATSSAKRAGSTTKRTASTSAERTTKKAPAKAKKATATTTRKARKATATARKATAATKRTAKRTAKKATASR